MILASCNNLPSANPELSYWSFVYSTCTQTTKLNLLLFQLNKTNFLKIYFFDLPAPPTDDIQQLQERHSSGQKLCDWDGAKKIAFLMNH